MEYTQFKRKCGHISHIRNSLILNYKELDEFLSTTVCTACALEGKLGRIKDLND